MFQTPIQKFDFVVSIITWIGLFGFVFDIQILTSIVWKCIFLFSVIWTLTAVLFFVYMKSEMSRYLLYLN